MAKDMFRNAWEQRAAQADQARRLLRDKIADAEKQFGALLDKLIEASSPRLISAYERRIEALEREKLAAAETLENVDAPDHPFGEMFEHALEVLANPYDLWKKGSLPVRRTVLRLAFAERIAYARNQAVRTPEYAFPFKALAGIFGGWKANGGAEGIRTPDLCIANAALSQLSYSPIGAAALGPARGLPLIMGSSAGSQAFSSIPALWTFRVQIAIFGPGRSAAGGPLANPVRSGRKQP